MLGLGSMLTSRSIQRIARLASTMGARAQPDSQRRGVAFAAAALLPAGMAAYASKRNRTALVAETKPSLVIVVGVSSVPGIGFAVAKRFASEGMAVALIGRQEKMLYSAADQIREAMPTATVDTAVADATNREQVQSAIGSFQKKFGPTAALVYNVSARPKMCPVMETTPERFTDMFQTNVMGAVNCAQAVIPSMLEASSGTIIFTGATASLRGSAKFSSFAAAKMALRGTAQAMARELNPEGVHVAHVIIDGMVDMPFIHERVGKPDGRLIDTDAIANVYWMLHCQDPACFTFEVDVRPHKSTW